MSRDHLGQFMVSSALGFGRGILLLDDCEGTFNWTVSGTGGDDVHEFATAAAFMGLKGMRLKTRTTGAAANDYVAAARAVGHGEGGLLVIRARVASPDVSVVKNLVMQVTHCDGVNDYSANINIRMSAGTVAYLDAAAAAVAMPDLAQTFTDGAWFTIELVLDVLTHEYLECFCNGTRVDLAGAGVYDVGASTERGAIVSLSVIAVGAAPAEMYADNIYVGEYLDL